MARAFGLTCFVRADRLFGYAIDHGGAVAYPTDPSQVGCTNKAAITTVRANTVTYSTDTTVSNARFRDGLIADGCVVTLSNCVIYKRTGGAAAVRSINGGSVVASDFELGIGPADSYVEEPNGLGDTTTPHVGWSAAGSATRGYIHHFADFIRLVSNATISDTYCHKLVSIVDGHGDGIQMTEGNTGPAVVQRVYVSAVHDPDVAVASGFAGVNGGFFLKADLAAIDQVSLSDSFLDSSGAYTIRVVDTGAFGQPTNVTISNVRIGSGHTSAPLLLSPADAYSVCGVSIDASGLLVAGVSSCPSNDGGTVADYVAGSVDDAGATLDLVIPASASTGDLMLVAVFDEGVQASGGTTDNSAPGGWTLIGQNNSPTRTKDLAVWRRFVQAGDTPGTTSFSFTGGSSASVGALAVYSGVDATAPIAASAFSDDDTFDTDRVITGATTTAANQRVVVVLGDQETTLASPPGDLTVRIVSGSDAAEPDVPRSVQFADKVQASAGATGTFTFTSAVSQRSCGAVIVLENAVTGSTFSGTGTPTQADQTSTASGTFTPPNFAATGTPTQADQTSTASGTFTAPVFSGTASPTQADQTATASGTFVTLTFSGSAAVTQAAQTSTASGTFTPGVLTGAAAITQDDQVAAGVGVGGIVVFRRTAKATATRRSHRIQ